MAEPSCTVCADFEAKIQRTYEELAETKMKGRREGKAVQRKLSRLLSAKHSHQGKQGCSRAKIPDAKQSLSTDL
jgi:hypothetical protein